MTAEISLAELQQRLLRVAQRKDNPRDLEVAIRSCMRNTKADSEMTTKLKLFLAELYFWEKELVKARSQYRKVLDKDPDSVEARIGMGHCFEASSRLGIAKGWYESAYDAAEKLHDCHKQITALDALAINAGERDDLGALSDILAKMCDLLSSAPRMEGLFVMIAEYLIRKRKGEVALSFLDCLVKHVLERGYDRGAQYLTLRPLVRIYKQGGRSEEDIRCMLDKLRSYAADETVARDFDIAITWALSRSHDAMYGSES